MKGADGRAPERALWAVVPAAGSGSRMARDGVPQATPKQYLALAGRTLIERALETLLAVPGLAGVVVALAGDDDAFDALDIARDPRVHRTTGAATRAGSVAAALAHLSALAAEDTRVLVHDAARPLVSLADVARLLGAVDEAEDAEGGGESVGGLLAVPVQDTLKRADDALRVVATVPRERLWRAQTPQLFRLGALRAALDAAERAGREITDEASAMELAGHVPRLVEALDPNPKITRAGDLDTAEALLAHRRTSACA